MLYQAVRGKISLGWLTFPSYETLPSLGNFTQTDVVYPAWVWLLSLSTVTTTVLSLCHCSPLFDKF